MKTLLLFIAVAQMVCCGNVGLRSSSLLAPAGVTYVDGSYHVGLAAGPVAYSTVGSQHVFQSPAVAAAPAVSVASQQVFQAAPAYAATATKYAAVPTVEHVQGVADVPVTRIEARPGVIQKTVDVARPAVKTQRFEVRRPAIQKQFYDIEERVVVRPAGSAVVELEQPLSQTQKGPSVIRPTGEAVAVTSGGSGVTVTSSGTNIPVTSGSGVTITSAGSGIAVTSSGNGVSGGSEEGVVSPPAPPSAADVAYARDSSIASAPVVPPVEVNYPRNTFSAPSVATISPASAVQVNYDRTSFASVPTVVGPPTVSVASAPGVVSSPSVSLASGQINYARASYSAPSVVAAPQAPPVQLNYARAPVASAVVAAPPAPVVGLSRASVSAVGPVQAYASPTVGSVSTPVQVSAPGQLQSGVSSVSLGASGVSSVPIGVSGIAVSTSLPPTFQQQIVQTTPLPVYDDSSSTVNAGFGLSRTGITIRQGYQSAAVARSGPQTFSAPARDPVYRSEVPARIYQGASLASDFGSPSRSPVTVNYPNTIGVVPQQTAFRTVTPVYERSPEVSQDNQQKLIELLTARGGVTEVGFGRSGPASYSPNAGEVRARVISATPAPAFSAPTGERVNTRRVVVSRPIETLQEVEVSEPVTKYERVQVNQPTLIKTARQEVVRVPTSVPVFGKTLAPVAEEAPAAYPTGWR